MNLAAAKRVAAHCIDQRIEQPGQTAQPVAHGARLDLDAVTGVHDRLAVERNVVGELRCGDVREQCRAGKTAIDGAARRRGLHDAVAARTGQLRATMTDDAEVRPQVLSR